MKIVKNIAVVAFATSFMFAGIGFHYANNYTNLDAGVDTATSWGVNYALNDNTTVGWDSVMGMLMNFDAPLGVSLRLGWAGSSDGTTTITAAFCDGEAGGEPFSGTQGDCENAGVNGGAGTWNPETETGDNNGLVAQTSVGLGFTWWTGGEGVKTSISTNFDYVMAPGAAAAGGNLDLDQLVNSTNLSVVVGFGF